MLIISPKTYSKTVLQVQEFFQAEKRSVPFWHSNFKDFYYYAEVEGKPVHILFCGYGEGTVAHGVIHGYERFLKKNDTHPGVLYVGACFATSKTAANIGDCIIPTSSESTSDIVKEMQQKSGKDGCTFDERLTNLLKQTSQSHGVTFGTGKIFCKETYYEDFWFPFAQEWGYEKGYAAGEVESAACLAASNLINVPCGAILEVKDKYDAQGYHIASSEMRRNAFHNILLILKDTIRAY